MNARTIPRFLLAAIAALSACGSDAGVALDAEADTAGSEDAAAGLGDLARRAVDRDPARAEDAIARLRAAGPTGHRALMAEHAAQIAALRADPPAVPSPELERLRHAIDVVSGQRDGHASGLYWFTDLALASAEARATGRPILALRLLGRLDEELSCANSRYFRVMLYADERVQEQLADDFVLYWSSERPAPRITIDMGDGRTIERTITGNSIHYVLDPEGRVVDGIPGLYTAPDFATRLAAARAIATECRALEADAFTACVVGRHAQALDETEARWNTLALGRPELPSWDALGEARAVAAGGAPSATEAMPITMGKMSVEMPMLDLMVARPRPAARPVDWTTLAAAGSVPALGESSLALLRLKTGSSDVSELAAALAQSAAADSLLNELTLHRVIHEWLANPASDTPDLARLNERVYTEIFLTPASDPWLGLRADDVWDAIESAGR